MRLFASLDMLKAAKFESDRVKMERVWYSTMCLLENQIEASQALLDFLEKVRGYDIHSRQEKS